MSPFKEPQPRKNLTPNPEHIVDGQIHKPLPRKSDPQEAKAHADIMEATARMPLMVVPDHTAFMARSAALEAAVKYVGNQSIEYTAQGTVTLADIFEDYLRNGKPS